MARCVAGLGLCVIGALATAGRLGALADYSYAIAWWGILLLVDEWNGRRIGKSLWHGTARHFLLVTVPVSVLFWLLFELLNLLSPQWAYRGNAASIHAQVLFGFASFATVIPIMVEACWLTFGSFCVPERWARAAAGHRWAAVALGVVLLALPLFNSVFWWNQGMWIAPLLLALPFVDVRRCGSPARFVAGMIAIGLLAGVCWEAINYPARTHWVYLILPGAPHLFQMPLPGYAGFIPFAVTALMIYEWQLRIRARALNGVLLYGSAIGVLYALTLVYVQRGLWLTR